jgi:hypothetical protein
MSTADELRAQAAQLLAQAAEVETPLTKEDVSRMWKARDVDGIEAARKSGRLDHLLGIKTKPEGN